MFTVVIPLFNKKSFIAATLESVLSQTVSSFEVVVVDDGSTDGSAEIVEAFPDPRIRLVQQSNQGVAAARNKGVEEARSPWIAFLDGDDMWRADHLSCLSRTIERFPAAGFISTRWESVSEPLPDTLRDTGENTTAEMASFFRNCVLERRYFHTSGIAVKRDVFRSVGGFGPYRRGQDVELWARLALVTPCAVVRTTTDFRREDPEGITSKDQARVRPVNISRRAMPTPVLRTLSDVLDSGMPQPERKNILLYHDFRIAVGVIHELRSRNIYRAIRLGLLLRSPVNLTIALLRRSDL